MGASKSINVTGANKNTATPSASGILTFTHFRTVSSDGATPKSGWNALTTPQTIDTTAGGLLNIADAGIKLQLGVAGNGTNGQFVDSVLMAMLDLAAGGFANTDKLQFATSSAGVNNSVIPPMSVDAWDAAVAF